ncbi:MAG: hypothetical protein GF349_01485 [Candidatus Magasanikbacteria bacterium]|nr:hypothetical protein [Candidatus Magasanikbacteria bacterium]
MAENNRSSLSREQKTGFGLLLIFGIVSIGLGFFQIRNNIYSPFALSYSEDDSSAVIDEQTRLQMVDTDQDGLNDFEEITFYETSAYIPDTDSDGIDDKTEVDQGTDPLCPEGEECVGQEYVEGETEQDENLSPLSESAATPAELIGNPDFVNESSGGAVDVDEILSDPTKLRELLATTGEVPAEVLENISDEQLLQMAQESMGEMENNSETIQ